jgi:GDP-L-fucose synthase
MYSDDMADACVFLLTLDESRYAALSAPAVAPLINVGTGQDLTIAELAALVCEVVGFRGGIAHDTTKPDGTPRKLLDVSKLQALGWRSRVSLREGIERAYADFRARFERAAA